MMISFSRMVVAIVLFSLWYPLLAEEPHAGQNAEEVQLSEAETLLWMTDQLHRIDEPTKLTYRFEKRGTFEEGFTDRVEFSVNEVKDNGMKAASLKFFTGERNIPMPAVENTDVNPVLKMYLQGDVYEMTRLTDEDGKARERWRYFQRRIKYALADDAVVEPVTINFSGREWSARGVRFRPYVDDPHRDEFEKFADKEYSIIVCDELPGYLYEIRTTVPGAAPQEPPLIQETLRLVKIEPN